MTRAKRILTYAFAASLALAPVAVVSVRTNRKSRRPRW